MYFTEYYDKCSTQNEIDQVVLNSALAVWKLYLGLNLTSSWKTWGFEILPPRLMWPLSRLRQPSLSLCFFFYKMEVMGHGQHFWGNGKVANERRKEKTRLFKNGGIMCWKMASKCNMWSSSNNSAFQFASSKPEWRGEKKTLTTRCLSLCTDANFLYLV